METDKQLVKERFEASFRRYDRLATVQMGICERLARRTTEYCGGQVDKILEIGAGTGFLTRRLAAAYPGSSWWLNDITDVAREYLERYVDHLPHEYIWGDAEVVDFPAGMDLVASSSTVQWFADLPAFFRKTAAATRTGGWLALSTFGPENFREIRVAAGEGLDYNTAGQLKKIVEDAGYQVLWLDEYTESMWFDTPSDVLHHIKAIGVNSIRKTRWSHRNLSEFETIYRDRFPDGNGRVSLTYHPLMVIAQKK